MRNHVKSRDFTRFHVFLIFDNFKVLFKKFEKFRKKIVVFIDFIALTIKQVVLYGRMIFKHEMKRVKLELV